MYKSSYNLFAAAALFTLANTTLFCSEAEAIETVNQSRAHEPSAMDPKKYSKHSSVQWTWAILSLDEIILNGNEHILDIGSADGKVSAHLAKLVPEGSVLGIDISSRAVTFAQRKFPSNLYPTLSFQTANVEELPYENAFDVVTAFLCLNWVGDVQSSVLQIAKVLKPGGTALITVPSPPDDKAREAFLQFFSEDKWKPYLHLFQKQNSCTIEDFQQFFIQAGLIAEKISVTKTAVVFHDKEDYAKWIFALNPGLSEIPSRLLQELNNKRLELLASLFPQAGDKRIYAFPEKITIVVKKP
jgi:ubiquinone/menaquinone biosynthesis C-methylase UbiE